MDEFFTHIQISIGLLTKLFLRNIPDNVFHTRLADLMSFDIVNFRHYVLPTLCPFDVMTFRCCDILTLCPFDFMLFRRYRYSTSCPISTQTHILETWKAHTCYGEIIENLCKDWLRIRKSLFFSFSTSFSFVINRAQIYEVLQNLP